MLYTWPDIYGSRVITTTSTTVITVFVHAITSLVHRPSLLALPVGPPPPFPTLSFPPPNTHAHTQSTNLEFRASSPPEACFET